MKQLQKQQSIGDKLLWLSAMVTVVAGLSGYYYLAQLMLVVRVAILLTGLVLGCVLVAKTAKGAAVVVAWHNAVTELRKIVWPSKQETGQAMLAVVIMVFIMSLLLWSLDAGLVKILKWLTN